MSPRWRRPGRLTAITIALAATVAAGQPATAEEVRPQDAVEGAYTVFNRPGPDGTPDYAVEEHFIDLVEATPAGAQIHGAMFSWTRVGVAEALADAQARGVEVSLAVDKEGSGGTTNTDPGNQAIATLKAAGFTRLTFCEGDGDSSRQQTGCIADRDYSINHQKLFSFSQTGDLTDVVWVSSQNWTNSQNNQYNNAVVIHGDAELHDFFVRHFDNMLDQRKDNDYFNSPDGYYRTEDKSVTVYFSPRADSTGGNGTEARTDTVALILGYIKTQQGSCTLDVAHASFTDARIAVADQLVRIARLGCDIRVVYGSMGSRVFAKLDAQSGISLKRYHDESPGNVATVSVHSKYIAFSGTYNGKPGRDIVFTGSHNLTGPALRNHDEILVKVEIPQATDGYAQNFETLWTNAVCSHPSSGSCP
ncbi:phosphatidylserine/phosphatidylglycerophosphate/cardiolipin synthase-like enzyme [Stackebrandtia albiflava]|uniref:phospholipase D n=1 Tax=Stackebrandtia albiflava TaxID=406432 RepID=A0A562VAR7_9ACTN|nr:phospholipase D-like domain-containing protein [Stackebrandtia albiflava]TWJ14979.1 phosphatidylserine/phosphatidylglycerophosphate/cardiolipin synthase-like enzyme [Stackebrandtia albiflava]